MKVFIEYGKEEERIMKKIETEKLRFVYYLTCPKVEKLGAYPGCSDSIFIRFCCSFFH